MKMLRLWLLSLLIIICLLPTLINGKKSGPISPATIFGFITKEEVLLSSTTKYSPQGLKLQSNYPWIYHLGQETIIGFSGDEYDCEELYGELQKEFLSHSFQYSHSNPIMTTMEIARYCRYLIAKGLRKRPYQVNVLIGGIQVAAVGGNNREGGGEGGTSKEKPILFWIDELGTMKSTKYAVFGRELPLLLGLLDQYEEDYRMNVQKNGIGLEGISDHHEAEEIIHNCWKIIQKRSNQELATYQTKFVTISRKKECQ